MQEHAPAEAVRAAEADLDEGVAEARQEDGLVGLGLGLGFGLGFGLGRLGLGLGSGVGLGSGLGSGVGGVAMAAWYQIPLPPP